MSTAFGPKGYAESPSTMTVGAAVLQYRGVKYGADNSTVIQSTNASVNVGVAADNQSNVGSAVAVYYKPGSLVTVEAGAAFALGAKLMTNASGQFITATTTSPVSAIAREAATAATQLVVAEIVNGAVTLAP